MTTPRQDTKGLARLSSSSGETTSGQDYAITLNDTSQGALRAYLPKHNATRSMEN